MGHKGVFCLAAAAVLCAAFSAAAQGRENCFRLSQVQSTRPDGDKRIYVRANVNDYYRIDLAHRCSTLTDPISHLVIVPTAGMDLLCGPLDFELSAADEGVREPCFVKSITKLSPSEAAAIPKKAKP